MHTVTGYRRPDGRHGIRNHVIVISLVQCANSVSDRIAALCGVPSLTMDWGCGEFAESAARTNLGMIRAGQNPNVYGVLLVSLGCEWTNPAEIGDPIRAAGKPVEHLCIQQLGGMTPTVEKGVEIVKKMQREAAMQEREPFPISELVIGATAGGSDWTSSINGNTCEGEAVDLFAREGASFIDFGIRGLPGSEQRAAELAVDYSVGLKILDVSEEFRHQILARTGQSIADVNPTPGNMAGGITTMAEKGLSNFKLKGSTPIQGVLEVGEQIPPDRHGMYIIDQRMGGNDVYACTAIAMGGAHLILFHTGRGSPLGNALCPVLKLTGNPHTASHLREMIDYDSAAVLTGEKTLEECGRELFELAIEVINGKQTKSEIFGDYSYSTPPVWSPC